MAHLPSQHPDLALHLTDRALTPLITSSRAQKQLGALTALSHTALSAHESALRLGLGAPQRIMVEHDEGGPVFLQTFLSPHTATMSTAVTTSLFPHNNNNNNRNPSSTRDTNPTEPQPSTSPSSSALDPNGTSSSQQNIRTPSQNNPRRQHQGALALAVENRNAAAASSSSTALLRSGAYPNDDDDDEEEEEERERNRAMFLGNDAAEISDEDSDEENPNTPAMLLGLVAAASSEDTLEARRAAARLERVGREIQGRWSEFQGLNPTPRTHSISDEQQQQRQGDAPIG